MRNSKTTKKQNENFIEVTKHLPIKFQEIIKDSLEFGRVISSNEHYRLVRESKRKYTLNNKQK